MRGGAAAATPTARRTWVLEPLLFQRRRPIPSSWPRPRAESRAPTATAQGTSSPAAPAGCGGQCQRRLPTEFGQPTGLGSSCRCVIRYTLFGNLKLFGSLSLCLSVAKQFHNFKLAIRHARSHEAQRLGEA